MSPNPKVLVTGSSGHLGKALMLTLSDYGYTPIGIDIKPAPQTTHVGSIADPEFVSSIFSTLHPNLSYVIHTATLHKPHICSHSKSEFIATNITGTLNLLEASVSHSGIKTFVFISTTSAFGGSLTTAPGLPAVWIDESVTPKPKNIYGVTKVAAEDVCELVNKKHGLPVVVLRTSRFFPEGDDDEERRGSMGDENLKVLELGYRRVDVEDVVGACVKAMERGPELKQGRGWGRYIISAPTIFRKEEGVLEGLDRDAGGEYSRAVAGAKEVFEQRGWKFLQRVDRVYDSDLARRELGWEAKYTFERAVQMVKEGKEWRSELTGRVGKLGYHDVDTGVYTIREEGK
ncbi:NAD dependent epimerase/dehydratase family protein [Apiosordaria backusii]|uniref:NAD dependent epimerase/dehydratase family protein n=1 Tax=Apiosordaria backusii TaxID=314023 RepID=A0AA40AMQ1_9PEZI|nr:NAD dependent epimerase/dehydratase family protein [Apiosordaria backusii]